MKYKFFFLSTVFFNYYIAQGVNNIKNNTTDTYGFTSLASSYHLNKFDGMFPIDEHWLITRKVSNDFRKVINKQIVSGQLKVPLFAKVTDYSQQLYTVTHYEEHWNLDIAMIQVKESISTDYIELGKCIDSTNNNLWVLVSGKKFEPSINEKQLIMSNNSQKVFAAFSKVFKSNNMLTLRSDNIDEFYEWAYSLLKSKQVKGIQSDAFLSRIHQEINTVFALPDVFNGIPESTDVGGIFLIKKEHFIENNKLGFKVFKPVKLTLVGLSVPNENNDEIEGSAIDLTHSDIQEWIQDTIFEYDVNNHDCSESNFICKKLDNIEIKESFTIDKKSSPPIDISKHRKDYYGNI